jgi:hypothetical protein
MNLKIYDKKHNDNDALVEMYTCLKNEYQEISDYRESTIEAFKPLEVAIEKLETKEAIDKIILYWVANLTYFIRVNYLINIVKLSDKTRRIKKKEIKDFTEIANSHIIDQIDSALTYSQFHISYFYFRFIEVRQERDLGETLLNAYLEAFQSAIGFVDTKFGNSASKFSDNYTLEILLKRKLIDKIDGLQSMAGTED